MMAICQFCGPWNAPLHMPAMRTPMGVIVPLTYDRWIWYHLHVLIHQHNNWSGELPDSGKVLDPPQQQAYS